MKKLPIAFRKSTSRTCIFVSPNSMKKNIIPSTAQNKKNKLMKDYWICICLVYSSLPALTGKKSISTALTYSTSTKTMPMLSTSIGKWRKRNIWWPTTSDSPFLIYRNMIWLFPAFNMPDKTQSITPFMKLISSLWSGCTASYRKMIATNYWPDIPADVNPSLTKESSSASVSLTNLHRQL